MHRGGASGPRRWWPRLRARWPRVAALAAAGAALLVAATPMGCYVSRAAMAEAGILARRQPIARLAADTSQDAAFRAKLRLVLEARQFAIDSLGLRAGNAFTAYSPLARDTLVLVLSAAYRDRLERRTWWFPVVGRFPYKGFFDFAEARRTAEAMRAEGMDVTLGASSAFSTLGWFNDPLVTPTVRQDSVTLVNTVLHELLHTTYFAKGRVSFNESFATFVGGRGAEHFFRARGDSAALHRAQADWHDDLLLGGFWEALAARLDSAYAAHPLEATARRLAARDSVYRWARAQLADTVAPQLRTYPAGWGARVPLDNAVLLARRVYAEGLGTFDAVYHGAGGDLRAAIARVITAGPDGVAELARPATWPAAAPPAAARTAPGSPR